MLRGLSIYDQQFRVFERKVMRKICDPIKNRDGNWRIRTNGEMDLLIKHADVVRYIKAQGIRWILRIVRMGK
jgi:hypothetical protein